MELMTSTQKKMLRYVTIRLKWKTGLMVIQNDVERGRSYIRRKVWLSDALFTFFEFIVYTGCPKKK